MNVMNPLSVMTPSNAMTENLSVAITTEVMAQEMYQ